MLRSSTEIRVPSDYPPQRSRVQAPILLLTDIVKLAGQNQRYRSQHSGYGPLEIAAVATPPQSRLLHMQARAGLRAHAQGELEGTYLLVQVRHQEHAARGALAGKPDAGHSQGRSRRRIRGRKGKATQWKACKDAGAQRPRAGSLCWDAPSPPRSSYAFDSGGQRSAQRGMRSTRRAIRGKPGTVRGMPKRLKSLRVRQKVLVRSPNLEAGSHT